MSFTPSIAQNYFFKWLYPGYDPNFPPKNEPEVGGLVLFFYMNDILVLEVQRIGEKFFEAWSIGYGRQKYRKDGSKWGSGKSGGYAYSPRSTGPAFMFIPKDKRRRAEAEIPVFKQKREEYVALQNEVNQARTSIEAALKSVNLKYASTQRLNSVKEALSSILEQIKAL